MDLIILIPPRQSRNPSRVSFVKDGLNDIQKSHFRIPPDDHVNAGVILHDLLVQECGMDAPHMNLNIPVDTFNDLGQFKTGETGMGKTVYSDNIRGILADYLF
jgi:hypothetical protein